MLFALGDPVSILYKSIAGRYWPVRVADEPITARCRFIKNASWGVFTRTYTIMLDIFGSVIFRLIGWLRRSSLGFKSLNEAIQSTQ